MDKNNDKQFSNAPGKGKQFRQMYENDENQRLAACNASKKCKHFREMDKNDKKIYRKVKHREKAKISDK